MDSDTEQVELKAYIRAALERERLTIRELARLAGVGEPTLYGTLGGAKRMGHKLLGKIAGPLQETPEKLYELAGIAVTETVPRTERIRRLLAVFKELDESDQDALILTAQSLHEQRKRNASTKNRQIRRGPIASN